MSKNKPYHFSGIRISFVNKTVQIDDEPPIRIDADGLDIPMEPRKRVKVKVRAK